MKTTTTMRKLLATAILNMTEEDVARVYNALSQWADNQRCAVDETDATEDGYAEMAADLLAVQQLEDVGAAALAALAD